MIQFKHVCAQSALLSALCIGGMAHAADYVPAHCTAVAGTLNIFWEAVGGASAPCTGIEFTDGTLADAADGSITVTGLSVSNPLCIFPAAYTLTQSSGRTSLIGSDTANNVPMALSLSPDGACYVGHWILGTDDYIATISAAPFPRPAPVASTVAAPLGAWPSTLLAGLLAILGCFFVDRARYAKDFRS